MIPDAKSRPATYLPAYIFRYSVYRIRYISEKYKPFSIPVTGSPHEPDRYNREPVG